MQSVIRFAKHPDMVPLHGGLQKGSKLIAANWADTYKVPKNGFKLDGAKHAEATPFERNNAMLEALPIGVLVCSGTGIQKNLTDKTRKRGISVCTCGNGA